MKFSYSFLKKLVPKIKSKEDLVDKLNLCSFEAEDLGGNTLDVKLPPNRFSDAAGHLGLAAEISAIYGKNFQTKNLIRKKLGGAKAPFEVKIKDKNLCSRYAARYFENITVKPSPKWMQEILISCGLKPINNAVDIMNYTMLEIGQPLHAFDYDKMEEEKRGLTRKQIIIRRAKKGERITTLDSQTFELDENALVIAGSQKLLAIAGIKGGKKAEVNENTKRIIVEAANFNSANIYKSSRKLGLITDASLRFSRDLSPELVGLGLDRAAQLLEEIVGANGGAIIDIYPRKPRKKIVGLNIIWLNKFIGRDFTVIEAKSYLERLGFKIIPAKGEKSFINKKASDFFVEVPILRQDIESQEDLAEEIMRLYGYNNLPSTAPHIYLKPLGSDGSENTIFKNKVRRVLASMGVDEILSYSFISEDEGKNFGASDLVELTNPVSKEFYYLRPSLESGLIKSVLNNFRFFDAVRVFEIGNVFSVENGSVFEKSVLGAVFASKTKETFFELKGVIDRFLKSIGIVDYLFAPENSKDELKIEINGKTIGRLVKINDKNHISLMEMNLSDLFSAAVEENEYQPLSKFPSIMRDLSIAVDKEKRVGEIMSVIAQNNLKFISDVDLIDEYESKDIGENKRSLTFRIVFQAKDRTLTDEEVNKMVEKIINELKNKFKAEIR